MAREAAPVYQDPQDELVERIERLMNDLELRTIGRLVDGIAAHFPGLAPAILAVHAHVRETGDRRSCGLEVDEGTWPGFENCADATRPPRLRPRTKTPAA